MWSTTADPNLRIITPDGFSLVVLAISCGFLGVSIIAVSLRSYIRIAKGIFGVDDAFLAAGTVVYMAVVGLSVYGLLVGLGRLEEDLNAWQWSEALKYYIIWILMYVVALAIVKSSVCLTILRIASTKKPLRISVWILLGVTWCSFCVTFIGTLLYCQPVNAIWTPQLILSGKAKCAPVETLIIIGHVATVSTILTDLALVVVPGFLLWETQMKRQAKLQAWGLLSFASVASIITMVRIPYVNKFGGGTNLQFWVAHTILCSNIETGIGCIASSIPSFRHFIRHNADGSSSGPSKPSNKRSGSRDFFTVGSARQNKPREAYRNPTDMGISLCTIKGRSDENWQRLGVGSDGSSEETFDPKRIFTQHTFSVDVDRQSQAPLRE